MQQQQQQQQQQVGRDVRESYPQSWYEPEVPDESQSETLGMQLLGVVAGGVRRLWSSSYTVLTVDLKRASISYRGPPQLTRRRQRRSRGPTSACVSPYQPGVEEDEAQDPRSRSKNVEATGAQARLKMMQVWELNKQIQNNKKRLSYEDDDDEKLDQGLQLNLGVGAEFELERGELNPKLRLRGKHASLHLLPRPMIELRKKWALPPYTHLGIDIRCRIPLTFPDKIWDSSSGARLMVNVFNTGGPGIQFTPGGILIEENVVELGRFTRMRIAAALEFPRELPWSEEEKPFKLEIRRVGIKARTQT